MKSSFPQRVQSSMFADDAKHGVHFLFALQFADLPTMISTTNDTLQQQQSKTESEQQWKET